MLLDPLQVRLLDAEIEEMDEKTLRYVMRNLIMDLSEADDVHCGFRSMIDEMISLRRKFHNTR